MLIKRLFLICILGILTNSVYSQIDISSRFDESDILSSSKNFTCEFVGIPESYKESILYAISILDNFFVTDVPINVKVIYEDLSYLDVTVIGGAKATAFYKDLSNDFIPNTYYPVALAEKILSKNLNGNEADILFSLDNNYKDFYLGTDGNSSDNQVDLVTLALHELIHGLGFYSNIKASDSLASFEYDIPTIFDRFIFDTSGKSICVLGAKEMYNAITSDSLFFKSDYSLCSNSDRYPEIYSPHFFESGSTCTHLSLAEFPFLGKNSLMKPYTKMGEAIHDPGDVALGIMAQIGWIEHFIDPDFVFDTENFNDSILISCTIDTSLQHNDVYLIYSLDNFANRDTLKMIKTGSRYSVKVPPLSIAFNHYLSYFISTSDSFNNNITSLIDVENPFVKTIYIGKDTIKPTIEHDAIKVVNENDDSIVFVAKITDNISVNEAFVVIDYDTIFINDTIKLEAEGTVFKATFPFEDSLLFRINTFSYRIIASDMAKQANVAVYPTQDSCLVTVFRESSVLHSYETDFESKPDIFSLTGFLIDTPQNFINKALYTEPFYKESGSDNVYINLIAEINKPFKVSYLEAIMSFDEVVLVEPGEYGIKFGQFGFWDYVIVEASKDKQAWHAFEMEGYDSRLHSNWLEAYYSNITSTGSSEASGTKELYVHHKINMLKNKFIRPGDNIYIRFRLQSDAKKYGWGWCIDNLEIQKYAPTNNNENTFVDDIIYTFNDDLKNVCISTKNGVYFSSIVINVNGISILATQNNCVNYNELPVGIYFLKTITSKNTYVQKFIVK